MDHIYHYPILYYSYQVRVGNRILFNILEVHKSLNNIKHYYKCPNNQNILYIDTTKYIGVP